MSIDPDKYKLFLSIILLILICIIAIISIINRKWVGIGIGIGILCGIIFGIIGGIPLLCLVIWTVGHPFPLLYGLLFPLPIIGVIGIL